MKPQPDFTPDELSVVQRWLQQHAQSCYSRARVYYRADATVDRALQLYDEGDTAWGWMLEVEATLEQQQREVQP